VTLDEVDGVEIIIIMVYPFRGWLTLFILGGNDAELMHINLPGLVNHLGLYWKLTEVEFNQLVQKVIGLRRFE